MNRDTLLKKYHVLDDGFVRVVDVMGSDAAIVQAARVSYGAGTKTLNDDRGLIRYMLRNSHWTPFEMCVIKLHIRMPIDVDRQFVRYRMSSRNEYSTRYSVAIDSIRKAGEWRLQSTTNKQGSTSVITDPIIVERLNREEEELHKHIRTVYEDRLSKGVAREQARKDLSISNYTEYYWKIDLRNMFNLLKQRMDSHAQWEIRQYANTISEIVKDWCPLSYEAFEDYILNSMMLSKQEIEILYNKNTLNEYSYDKLSKREISEFEEKLKLLGIKHD